MSFNTCIAEYINITQLRLFYGQFGCMILVNTVDSDFKWMAS